MDAGYLPEFGGVYLEDSYFLGLTAEASSLRLKMLLALTTDHQAYAPPAPEQQHCYRDGAIVLERPSILRWQAGRPAVIQDPDGSFDFGGVQLFRLSDTSFRIVTDWFDAAFAVSRLSVELID